MECYCSFATLLPSAFNTVNELWVLAPGLLIEYDVGSSLLHLSMSSTSQKGACTVGVLCCSPRSLQFLDIRSFQQLNSFLPVRICCCNRPQANSGVHAGILPCASSCPEIGDQLDKLVTKWMCESCVETGSISETPPVLSRQTAWPSLGRKITLTAVWVVRPVLDPDYFGKHCCPKKLFCVMRSTLPETLFCLWGDTPRVVLMIAE